MRWTDPKLGDTRILSKFLILPRKIEGETRWLEFAIIQQRFMKQLLDMSTWTGVWEDESWVEEPEPRRWKD